MICFEIEEASEKAEVWKIIRLPENDVLWLVLFLFLLICLNVSLTRIFNSCIYRIL